MPEAPAPSWKGSALERTDPLAFDCFTCQVGIEFQKLFGTFTEYRIFTSGLSLPKKTRNVLLSGLFISDKQLTPTETLPRFHKLHGWEVVRIGYFYSFPIDRVPTFVNFYIMKLVNPPKSYPFCDAGALPSERTGKVLESRVPKLFRRL
jgi:hypothetical protein